VIEISIAADLFYKCRGLIYMPIDFPGDLNQLELEVAAAREQLAQLEQEHADLTMDLRGFELLYQARVGPVQAQLEAAQLHIAEYKLRIELLRFRGRALAPSQLEAEVEWQLREQRRHAESTETEAQAAQNKWSAIAADQPDPAAHLDLKQLYRELAKRLHPDLTPDPAERVVRSQRMAQVNELYAQHQLDALRQILRDVTLDQARVRENDEQRLRRLKYERTQLTESIRRFKSEIAELERSALLQLKIEYALQKARGHNVLDEMADRMRAQVQLAQNELAELITRFRELIESIGWTN
jgi:hypothetical protein